MKKSIVMKSNEIYMCLEFLHSFFETDAWCFILRVFTVANSSKVSSLGQASLGICMPPLGSSHCMGASTDHLPTISKIVLTRVSVQFTGDKLHPFLNAIDLNQNEVRHNKHLNAVPCIIRKEVPLSPFFTLDTLVMIILPLVHPREELYFESALRFLVDRGRRAGDPLFSLLIKSSFLGRPRPRGTLLQSLTRNRFGRVRMELGVIFITLPERRGLNARRQVELVERGG